MSHAPGQRNGEENAFPQGSHSSGLTKRELFAAMAMDGLIVFAGGNMRNDERQPRSLAQMATAYADALLAALAKAP